MKFKSWVSLQDILDDIHTAVEADQLSNSIIRFVSTAMFIPEEELNKKHWMEVAILFLSSQKDMGLELQIPMFSLSSSSTKTKLEWDYKGRNYYAWVHPVCAFYGWTLEYIDELDHNIVLAFIQEIELEKQFKREWEWSLSEMAYPYNSTTKKSSFSPLERPEWMKKRYEAPKTIRLKKSSLPSGNVVKLDESTTSG